MDKHWSIETALKQISSCNFQCEAGPLSKNEAWDWLERAAKIGPEFWPGQGVWFEVVAEAAGVSMKQKIHFFIVGCSMKSDTERRYWVYDLSYDPPAPWHYGTVHFTDIPGSKLSLTKDMPHD